ncbi:hypothetical protein SAMD00023353_1600190 [Rosellinia necatrix]|uniref:NmrA-like domain-containing protein n=1 Tax=Rosellinia necatrix TaxID=77044 RepID=A0A1W2TKP8_ROSNE|nr:hypothetical protein SAMD00023353_1600190 [Rosellinia necatrix]
MTIKNVALFGANGNLGTVLLEALARTPEFHVTVIKRASSPYTLPPSLLSSSPPPTSTAAAAAVSVRTVDDALSTPSLEAALAGQDAVVVSIPLRDAAQHLRIADAAAAAGVRRLVPADYGSCDSASPRAQELVPLFARKTAVRERLQELSAATAAAAGEEGKGEGGEEGIGKGRDFSWTSIVCGHFFDWGLRRGFLHFDIAARRADVLDHGRYRSSTATLGRVAEAVVAVLRRAAAAAATEGEAGEGEEKEQVADETRNRVLFVQSFCVSQLDVLAALERATGGAAWDVSRLESEAFIANRKAKADAGDAAAVEDLVFALGAIDGDWEGRDGFAMDLLGLENEDLDEVVGRVVAEQLRA